MQNRDFWVKSAYPETFPAAAVLQRQESFERAIRPNGSAIRPIQSTNRPIGVTIRPIEPNLLFLKYFLTVSHPTDWDGHSADPFGRSTDRAFITRPIRITHSADRYRHPTDR